MRQPFPNNPWPLAVGLLAVIAAAPALAQVETSPGAEAERWWAEATRFVELKQTGAALAALDNLVEIKRLHPNLELPRRFWVVRAATAEAEGLHDVAVASAQRYVNQPRANSAPHYSYAIRLVVDAYLEAARQAAGDREIYTLTTGGAPVEGLEPPVRRNPRSYQPRRTREAAAAGAYGAVVVGYVINERGSAEDPVVLQDPGYGLATEVERAVKRRKYRPATLHGEPVAVFQVVTINFPPLR